MLKSKKILTDRHYSKYEYPFDTLDYGKLNMFFKFISIADSSHLWTMMRVPELVKWNVQGALQKLSIDK